MDKDGKGVIVLDNKCNNFNAVWGVTCEDFKVACPTGKNFFFRLVTSGEIYSLGKYENGKIIEAPNGILSCDEITKY